MTGFREKGKNSVFVEIYKVSAKLRKCEKKD